MRRVIYLLTVFLLAGSFFSGCAVRARPECGGVYYWPEKNQEIGYDLDFQENASGTPFAVVHFVYCRVLTDSRYYVNQKAVFNRLADLISPKNAPVGREQAFITDGVHSYPLIRFFIDTDTQTCRGLALIDGELDRSRASFVMSLAERPTVRAGEAVLEYVFYKNENADEWGCSAAIRFPDVPARNLLSCTAEGDGAILTETETGARFRLMLDCGDTQIPVLPAWVTPVYDRDGLILSGLDLRIPKSALPGGKEPALILEEIE